MKIKVYPERKRCRKCGKALKNIVLDGIYCSYDCGQLPAPIEDIDKAPRQCKMERDRVWMWKQRYRSIEEVPDRFKEDAATNIYRCNNCRFLHIGHSRPLGKETSYVVYDNVSLGTFLQKVRENRKETRRDIATKIRIRPIRIKEIEEGSAIINTEALFLLLKYYKMKINILF